MPPTSLRRQIHKASLFSSYRIESNQPESSIHLSLAVGPLLTVLKSAVANQGKGEVVLKLAKRAQAEGQAPRPMLVWEIGGDVRCGLLAGLALPCSRARMAGILWPAC